MIEALDDISEIPFEVFKDKFMELKSGIYNWEWAQKEWFYMHENDRVMAFSALCNNHPIIQVIRQPYEYLQQFNLLF